MNLQSDMWCQSMRHYNSHLNKSNPVFQECWFFTGRLCCHTGQYSVVRSARAFFSNARSFQTYRYILHFWKGCSMSIILHCILCKHMDFSKKGYWSFERKVRQVDLHTALLQRACCNFSRITSYFVWIVIIVPAKTRCMPQKKIILIQKGMLHVSF